jgi:hypothetical protein
MKWDKIDGFLSREEVKKMIEKMKERKEDWIERPFNTSIGRIWYLDIEMGLLHMYHWEAPKTNVIVDGITNSISHKVASAAVQQICKHYSDLNTKVVSRTEYTEAPWVDMGIVINQAKGKMENDGGAVHADLEGLSPYPELFSRLESVRAFSVIIPIELPQEGGGLYIWNKMNLPNSRYYSLDDSKAQLIEYKVGNMYIFDSRLFHRIAPSKFSDRKRRRTILGMHLLYDGNISNAKGETNMWQYWF